MTRPALSCIFVMSTLALPAAAATGSSFAERSQSMRSAATATSHSGSRSVFAEQSQSMRADVRPGRHAWSSPAPFGRPSSTCPATTTQITVINVNAPVGGDVVIVNNVNGSCAQRSPLVVGSERIIAGRATVQPVVSASGRVVVRRW